MNLDFLKTIPFWAHKRLRWLFGLFLLFLALAGATNYAYYMVKSKNLNIVEFSDNLHKKEAYCDKLLNRIIKQVAEKGLHSVTHDQGLYAESEKNNVAIFIIKGDSLCWWSSNSVDVRSPGEVPYAQVFYSITHNSYCMGVQRADADYRYVAYVKFKQRPYKGGFTPQRKNDNSLALPPNVQVVERTVDGANEIKSVRGTYLFSIKVDAKVVHNDLFLWLTGIFTFFAIVFLFCWNYSLGTLSQVKVLKRKTAVICTVSSFIFIIILVALKWPESLFANPLFSSTYYTSFFVGSLGQLAIYTFAFFCLYSLLHRLLPEGRLKAENVKVKIWKFVVAAQFLSGIIFFAIYCLTVHLVYNSTMDVATSLVHDISLVTVISLLLVIPWFVFSFYLANALARQYVPMASMKQVLLSRLGLTVVGLVIVVLAGGAVVHFVAWGVFSLVALLAEVYYHYKDKRSMFYMVVLAFVLINLTVSVCYLHCGIRNSARYARMAERLTNNIDLIHNADDETVMLENGRLILHDKKFHNLMADTSINCFENVERYLLETYFDGFGNKYEFDVQVRPAGKPFLLRKGYYENSIKCSPNLMSTYCSAIGDSKYFYICKRPDLPLAYAGVFPHKGKVAYVFLYPCLSVYRQEQDAELYAPSNVNISANDFSVVKYYNNEMLFLSGDYHYPNTASWIPSVSKKNFHVYKPDCTHFISRFLDNGFVVVTKIERSSYTYFIFVSYLCGIFAFGILIYGMFVWASMQRRHAQYSLLTRMQIWLLGPLLLAFIVLAFCSMYFFMAQYKSKTVSGMSEQAGSIQLNLQQKVGFASSLNTVDLRRLSQDVKDLSNLFRADIVVYDASGRQVVSSRTSFLNERRRHKRLMYPIPFFMHQPDYFREANYSNHNFFSYYTNLYNQRNQMVGYVNVRSSSGAEQMRNELFNLMVILIDVYLVIVLLTIVISWLISRRFTRPVAMLADQFKEIKLTGSNTKVDYNDNDELGSLVQQYNVMVDKLQLSAEQLAQSQRELAWRDMARRIAHEIKNPLTPMKLSVQMAQMKQQRDPENFPEYFEKTSSLLIEQIDNLSRIASEFSTFAKTTVTVREEVDLASKVRSVVALFENNQECVQFELDMHDVDSAMVWSDNKQILQVFNNLFRNAIQAIPDTVAGLIKVDFQIKDEAALIAITDNGCGIPEENMQTIFQPNFTTKTSGMGLGLSIVKTIVNLANGEIWVDSTVGVGTTFYIRIPLIKPGEKAEDVLPPVTPQA